MRKVACEVRIDCHSLSEVKRLGAAKDRTRGPMSEVTVRFSITRIGTASHFIGYQKLDSQFHRVGTLI